MPDESAAAAASDLDFAIEKSLRYHQRRRAHYERWHRRVMFGALLAGSAAVANFHPQLAGIVVAVLAALDLTVGFSSKARDHETLHRRFTNLAIKLRATKDPDVDALISLRSERMGIEADEPPIYWALEASCYNEALYAMGRDARDEVVLNRFQILAMNYLTFDKELMNSRKGDVVGTNQATA